MADHVLIVAVVFLTGFLGLYVIVTSRNKERMAMIERGIAPNNSGHRMPLPQGHLLQTLKWGLSIFSVGVGFVTALVLRPYVGAELDDELQPALMLLCGGAGLMIYYFIAAKKLRAEEAAQNNRP